MRTAIHLISQTIIGASLLTAQVAVAQTPPPPANVTVGSPIYDPQGNDVGSVKAISGDNVVVSTGTQDVTLSKAAFAQWPKGITIGMTRDELNAAASKAKADAAQALVNALVPGADVHSLGGNAVVGKIKTVEAEQILLTTEKGDVNIPKAAFIMGTAGLSVGYSAEQFEQAVAQAAKPAA